MVPGSDFTSEAPLSTSSNAPKWEAYTKTPEARGASHENEKDVFADLENIAEQIVKCCREIDPRLQQTNELRSNGTKTLPCHIYTSAQPDGIRVLLGMKPSWLSVALSEEYKLKASDALDVSGLYSFENIEFILSVELSEECLEHVPKHALRLPSPLRFRRDHPQHQRPSMAHEP